jgi:hypothetical protein
MSSLFRLGPRWWAVLPPLLLLAGIVRAQPPGSATIRELEDETRKYKSTASGGTGSISELLKGEVTADPNKEEHKKALEAEARLVAHRLFDKDYHQPYNPDPAKPGETNPKSIHKTFLDYEGDLVYLVRNKDKTQNARKIFGHAVLEQGKEVLQAELRVKPTPRPIVLMNVARMMARTADLGQGETADVLVELLRNPPAGNQGAQYWAARGLHDLLEKSPTALNPEQMEKTAQALSEFVEKKVVFTQGAPEAEKDGYRSLRREAIRALALTRLPACADKAKPAWTLLKVMSASDIVPEPRMDERAEAAIGLARMRPPAKNEVGYQPDYAAQQIVAFGRDFGSFYQKEYRTSGLPCRILAARLNDELKALKDEVKDPYIGEAVTELARALDRMERGDTVTPEALRDWLESHKAPNQALFKSDPKTTLGAAPMGQ